MLHLIDLREKQWQASDLAKYLPRAEIDIAAATRTVGPIIQQVRAQGKTALDEMSARFDQVVPSALRVPPEQLQKALEQLDPALRRALEISIEHNRAGHAAQLPTPRTTQIMPGGTIEQRWVPVERVGLYVPGGLAVYPSSVVMNVVAAQVAQVGQIALASPAQAAFGGWPHPTILAACALLGVDEVYAMGGAGAIAAFAYGVKDSSSEAPSQASADTWLVPPVDVITGPGNIYVAAAKRAVAGVCGIDAEAGTTEIAIVADATARPSYVAADLISQAEHDPAAASVLITDSPQLAAQVQEEITKQVAATKHAERVTRALSGPQSGIILVKTKDQALAVANAYAAEHLEIQTENATADAAKITNAGAIFVGPYSPVPLGDYLAGSNHVLPTGGTARFNSGLNVMVFLKSMQVIHYDAAATAQLTEPLVALATNEDLPAHGQALTIRQSEQKGTGKVIEGED